MISSFGCENQTKKSDRVFDSLSHTLQESNSNIRNANNLLYQQIESNFYDPISHERASIWNPKAKQIQRQSQILREYIDSIESRSGEYKLDVTAYNNLYERIKTYKDIILSVDDAIKKDFENRLNEVLFSETWDSSSSIFYATYFANKSKSAVIAVLNGLKHRILLIENVLIQFCYYHSKSYSEAYQSFSILVGQSTNIIERGGEIEINAGVGAFSRNCSPHVYIAGKEIELNENAVADYKFKANAKPGKYIIPVKINYTDPSGAKQSKTLDISYKIKE